MAIAAWKNGLKKIILPAENAKEAAVVKDIEVYGAHNMYEVLGHLSGEAPLQREAAGRLLDGRQGHCLLYTARCV